MNPVKFGRYEIQSELGTSQSGVVYLARDPSVNRQVALRILPAGWSDTGTKQRAITRRLKELALLSHPAIVPILDYGTQVGRIFVVSRYMPGGSLADRLARNDFPYQELPYLLQRLASALEFASSLGIVHGEIRPSNILFDEAGDACLSDFSVLPPYPDQNALQAGVSLGDLCYISPEQIQGQPAGAASDIYSLGTIAFEVLGGYKPFYGSTAVETITKHLTMPVPQVSQRESHETLQVQRILEHALAKNPQERFPSAGEFGQALAEALLPKEEAVGAEPPESEGFFEEEEETGLPPIPSVPGDDSGIPFDPRNPVSPRTEPPSPKTAVVNTGFALPGTPADFLDPHIPLAPQASYYFCLGVGEAMAHSAEVTPTALPDTLPVGAELQVALFGFPGEIELDPQASVGTLRLGEGLTAAVEKQPGQNDLPAGLPWLAFPVKTPPKTGRWRLRCSIYYQQFLVQSRLVTVEVRKRQQRWSKQALRSTLDYNLTQSLSAKHLTGMKQHRLSLMINENSRGTHGFRFFGEQEFKSDATLDGQELQDLIEFTRGVLRLVAWGDEKPWKDQAYRYSGNPDLQRFKADLIRLAVRGYRTYDQLVNRLAGGAAQVDQLAGLMSHSGLVQVALKQDARHVLPVAMLYDYPFDTAALAADYEFCPQFMDALNAPQPLEDCQCFHGECPSKDDEITICPSGFWGFRHAVGLPLSLAEAPDAPTTILAKDKLDLLLSVCLDPAFVMRADHETRLRSLFNQATVTRAADRQTTFSMMQQAQAHLVYFYCHGGVNASNIPYIQIGALTERGITRDNLRLKRIAWKDPRPLIFINGCHTTALEPESAFELVSGFIETAGAAGVIGTEITIFEPLATAFAESFLQSFNQGIEVGEAVRLARLRLLKQLNPLGLVYIPFAMANLRLEVQG